ncbi:precorrin-6y C5,15-methyltransferase (decarboxylating) subunit CbiE [Nakamurella sp.]|uniref:precorrin-6y C5,15-methyltransferase (decarboxylating) subunit CbiE n=1 Tax=Nakamurella sp. TaxID=1869182 RepID=UPI003B3A8C86
MARQPATGAAPVDVVGIGADGWAGLTARTRDLIAAADALVGSPRQLDAVPADAGPPPARRIPLPSPLREGLPDLLATLGDRRAVVLASGDPLVYGIAATLIDLVGASRVRVHPTVSSVALAAAQLGWPSDSFDVVRVASSLAPVRRVLTPGRRVLVLSADERTPLELARLLVGGGHGRSALTVLADLGTPAQSRHDSTAERFAATPPAVSRLNVVALTVAGSGGWPTVGGLPDEAFEHDGQLTKRDARACALARLAPAPGHVLWDVGAGAGSVAIEWSRTDPRCRAVAVERDAARADRIGRNAAALGATGVRVVTGRAPAALAGLPTPDAIFVGGGAGVPGLLDTCWQALGPGGRLVVHAVTLETEALLVERQARLGGELIRLSVERVEPLGGFRGWVPARPVVQWCVTR